MILNSSLLKMMDRTECLIFIDTPNSLESKDLKEGRTNSGWIYSELIMSKFIEKKVPIRKGTYDIVTESAELKMKYDVDITHLIRLSVDDIKKVNDNRKIGESFLDGLYYEKGIYKGE